MNKRQISSKLEVAISALQSVANELKKETPVCPPQPRWCCTPTCPPPASRWCPCPPTPPRPEWGVAGEPKQDPNKIFGINVRVDEPRAQDYRSRWEFERDHAKFDRLADAAEACTWENKSNTAPLHKVNAIRRRIEDGPVMGVNLVGETWWF